MATSNIKLHSPRQDATACSDPARLTEEKVRLPSGLAGCDWYDGRGYGLGEAVLS